MHITKSLALRFGFGGLQLGVIFLCDVILGKEYTAQYLICLGAAGIFYSFSQGVMPTQFAMLSTKENINSLHMLDLKRTFINTNILIILVISIQYFFQIELIKTYLPFFYLFVLAISSWWAIAKFELNLNGVDRYVFFQSLYPSLFTFVAIILVSVLRIEASFFIAFIALVLFLPCVYLFLKNNIDSKIIKFQGNLQERVLRLLIGIIEHIDILLLPILGVVELVYFSYIKRVTGIGGVASSIITKTYEKRIASGLNVKVSLKRDQMFVSAIQGVVLIALIILSFSYLDDNYYILFISAGLVSLMQINTSGSIVTVTKNKTLMIKAIIILLIAISTCVLYFSYDSNQNIETFAALYLFLYFIKIITIKNLSK